MTKIETLPAATESDLIHLSSRQQEVLNLAALGLSVKEIGDKMYIAQGTAKAHNIAILCAFGVGRRLEVVIKGVTTGNVDLEESTKDLNTRNILKLSKSEKRVLDTMTQNKGENSRSEKIAPILGVTKNTIRMHFQSIVKKLEINRTRAGLLWLRYKKENPPQEAILK